MKLAPAEVNLHHGVHDAGQHVPHVAHVHRARHVGVHLLVARLVLQKLLFDVPQAVLRCPRPCRQQTGKGDCDCGGDGCGNSRERVCAPVSGPARAAETTP